MPRPLESILSQWPVLYPEMMGADEQDDNSSGEADRIRELVVTTMLQSRDIASTFTESREAYRVWKESRTSEATDLAVVLDREDRLGDNLSDITLEHQDDLGERAIRAIQEDIKLRKIVRRSVLPYRETWHEESWERIGHLMTSSELCIAGILEYLTTGVGLRGNIETLAAWGFQYALDAYYDAGDNGRNWVKLEDIPE